MVWIYNPDDYNEHKSFSELIPVGKHRVRIENAEEMISKNGRDMIKLTFAVSGYSGKLFYYLVLNEEQPVITNQRIGEIYNSFGIVPKQKLMPHSWIGRVGAAMVKHEMYNDREQPKIAYFIKRDMQADLPKWMEGSVNRQNANEDEDFPYSLDADGTPSEGRFGSVREEEELF